MLVFARWLAIVNRLLTPVDALQRLASPLAFQIDRLLSSDHVTRALIVGVVLGFELGKGGVYCLKTFSN
ncbi:MAG TPA: hypothetical protein VF331_03850 [Polyangiales bacterium]